MKKACLAISRCGKSRDGVRLFSGLPRSNGAETLAVPERTRDALKSRSGGAGWEGRSRQSAGSRQGRTTSSHWYFNGKKLPWSFSSLEGCFRRETAPSLFLGGGRRASLHRLFRRRKSPSKLPKPVFREPLSSRIGWIAWPDPATQHTAGCSRVARSIKCIVRLGRRGSGPPGEAPETDGADVY